MGFIRILLALIVVVSHTDSLFGFTFVGGKIAVQTFYIISGFYMALILNEKYIGFNNSYKLYLTNRLIRLYPIYWVVLLLIIIPSLAYGIYNGGENFAFLNNFVDYYDTLSIGSFVTLVFSNIFIFFQDALLFFEVNLQTGSLFFQPKYNSKALNGFDFALIPQAWTVSLELMFYIIAPFIVKRKTIIICVIFTLLLVLRIIIHDLLLINYTPWNFRFFPIELTYFLAGVLSYKIYKTTIITKSSSKLNKLIFIFILLIILCYDVIKIPLKNELFFVFFFLAIPFIFKLTKKSKFDRYIGELSYPVYIVHMVLVSLYKYFENYFSFNKCVTIIICSLFASIILKHIISDKIEVYRQKRIR